MGAIRLCLATDVDPTVLTIGAAAALKFDPPTDPAAVQLQQMISEQGVESVVHSLAGSDEVAEAVLKTVRG